jgi:hypothetical protein
VKSTVISDCRIIELPRIYDPSGNITAVNNQKEVPFAVKRIYYLYDVPGGEARGGHAHKELQQLIVAASGSFDIALHDGKEEKIFSLSRPYEGLYLAPGIWRALHNFSSGAICLVLASTIYSEDDYIRDYDDFTNYKSVK